MKAAPVRRPVRRLLRWLLRWAAPALGGGGGGSCAGLRLAPARAVEEAAAEEGEEVVAEPGWASKQLTGRCIAVPFSSRSSLQNQKPQPRSRYRGSLTGPDRPRDSNGRPERRVLTGSARPNGPSDVSRWIAFSRVNVWVSEVAPARHTRSARYSV